MALRVPTIAIENFEFKQLSSPLTYRIPGGFEICSKSLGYLSSYNEIILYPNLIDFSKILFATYKEVLSKVIKTLCGKKPNIRFSY